jgi:hypothetical protein
MPKEYFSHDYNARNDPKCIALIKDFGMSGYGVYWCLIEMMNEQGGRIKKFPLLYRALAHDLKVKEVTLVKQIEAMLHQLQLLVEDEKYIWSESTLSRLAERESKRSKQIKAGKLGGINSGISRRNGSLSKQAFEATEANEAKESKGKEIKEKESIVKGIYPKVDHEIELSAINIGQAIEYIFNTKKAVVNDETIRSLFTVFKTKNLTGKKFYNSNNDIISHFFNSLKYENITHGTTYRQPTTGNRKSAGANQLVSVLKDELESEQGRK